MRDPHYDPELDAVSALKLIACSVKRDISSVSAVNKIIIKLSGGNPKQALQFIQSIAANYQRV